MYHFLNTAGYKKLGLENWDGIYMDPTLQEKQDYVLVNGKVWEILKDTYGGGPEIPFFLTDNDNAIDKYDISKVTRLSINANIITS